MFQRFFCGIFGALISQHYEVSHPDNPNFRSVYGL